MFRAAVHIGSSRAQQKKERGLWDLFLENCSYYSIKEGKLSKGGKDRDFFYCFRLKDLSKERGVGLEGCERGL